MAGTPRKTPKIQLHRCPNGHTFFRRRERCPTCGGRLDTRLVPADARLLSHTVVRVGPAREPFTLGIAEVEAGAKTLCIVESDGPVDAGDSVVLVRKNGRFHAVAAR